MRDNHRTIHTAPHPDMWHQIPQWESMCSLKVGCPSRHPKNSVISTSSKLEISSTGLILTGSTKCCHSLRQLSDASIQGQTHIQYVTDLATARRCFHEKALTSGKQRVQQHPEKWGQWVQVGHLEQITPTTINRCLFKADKTQKNAF